MSGRSAYLRLLERAARAAEQASTLADGAARLIPEVCAVTGWPGGRLAGAGEDLDGPELRFPVALGGEVVAWLAFTVDGAAPDDELAAVLGHVAGQLARVEERARADRRFRLLAGAVRDAVVATDESGSIVAANRAAERLLGYPPGGLPGQRVADVLPAISEAAGEVRGVRGDGARLVLEVTRAGPHAFVLREARAMPRDQLHDTLTGLANRLLIRDRLEHALASSGRRGQSVAVIAVDLDRFKMVNDTYGPSAGDALLVAVAGRLQTAARSGDTVGRVAGDEFAVVCEDVAGEEETMAVVADLLTAFREPFTVEGRDVALTPSMGIALAPSEGVEAGQLLRDAEVARERARERGYGEVAVYDESMRVDASLRLSVEHELRTAIQEGQLRLHYQPIVDLDAKAVVGVEALVRWEHPSRGLLHPQDFIGAAEDSGLIVPLGRWVLEQACRQGALWQNGCGHPAMRVSVNVSARQFRQEQWADDVAGVLEAAGLPPGQLVLEITESMLMEDIDTTRVRLAQLRDLGVRIAIDDFGTGYSSLGYLRHLPVDILKVDKSFIDGVAQGPHESALARAVIKLAETLRLDAVAEGVNSQRQYAQLRRLRCRFGQGYFFSPPVPADRLSFL
ncbi:MAG: putative bifunctional diguanylate cyclase/phosphodiesterase [Acidimicrobiales bacterium]